MVSQFLRELKAEKKLTTQQIADRSRVPLSTVSRVLSGPTDNPSFATICAIVKAMDGSLDELAGIKPNIPEPIQKAEEKPPEGFDLRTRTKWISWLIAYSLIVTLLLIGLLVALLVVNFPK